MDQLNPNMVATRLEIGLSKEDEARLTAKRKGIDLSKLGGASGIWKKLNDAVMSLNKIKLQEKVTFFQLLAVMLNAGVPLIRSLKVLSGQTKNKRLQRIVMDLAVRMEEGKSLSEAMEKYDWLFSESDRGMVASGEVSGNLNSILQDIAKQSEKNSEILSKVKGAMIYPASVLFIMLVAIVVMLTLVVPKIESLFADGGQELPLSTQILITSSEFTQANWDLMAILFLVFALGVFAFQRSKRGKLVIDAILIRVPIFGKLVRQVMIARFARMMSSLMLAGIPIVKALEINANAVGNAVYKQRIQFASQDVAQGIPLGENMKESEFLFPPMVASMVLVGEQTANLTEVSLKIAEYYEIQVDTAVRSLSKLMEPVILVTMGLLVGFMVAAIMQPIIALSDISTAI
jgi:type IV pilus assembly protein PilC